MDRSSLSAQPRPHGEVAYTRLLTSTVCECAHTHTHTHTHRLDGKHVVFGSVVEGYDVIDKVEGYGSESGKTSKKITITDCGEQ